MRTRNTDVSGGGNEKMMLSPTINTWCAILVTSRHEPEQRNVLREELPPGPQSVTPFLAPCGAVSIRRGCQVRRTKNMNIRD